MNTNKIRDSEVFCMNETNEVSKLSFKHAIIHTNQKGDQFQITMTLAKLLSLILRYTCAPPQEGDPGLCLPPPWIFEEEIKIEEKMEIIKYQ